MIDDIKIKGIVCFKLAKLKKDNNLLMLAMNLMNERYANSLNKKNLLE